MGEFQIVTQIHALIGQEYLSDLEEEVTISVCLVFFITQYGITSYVYRKRNGQLVPFFVLLI